MPCLVDGWNFSSQWVFLIGSHNEATVAKKNSLAFDDAAWVVADFYNALKDELKI